MDWECCASCSSEQMQRWREAKNCLSLTWTRLPIKPFIIYTFQKFIQTRAVLSIQLLFVHHSKIQPTFLALGNEDSRSLSLSILSAYSWFHTKQRRLCLNAENCCNSFVIINSMQICMFRHVFVAHSVVRSLSHALSLFRASVISSASILLPPPGLLSLLSSSRKGEKHINGMLISLREYAPWWTPLITR